MEQLKEKILVSAYACEPGLGSEIGVGWHWVIEMSKYFDLWVLTRKSNKERIEKWIEKNGNPNNIKFVYFDLPKSLRWWKKGRRGVRAYYTIWQTLTNRIIKKVMLENQIKIYHLLTYGNSLWKASRYGIKQFFVWGPTGGVDTIPSEYSRHYDVKSRIIEFVRRSVVKTLPLNIGFNKRCRNANLIFCKSHNMYNAIPEKYRKNAMLFTDVAVEMNNIVPQKKERNDAKIKYIVVGQLDAWRAFDVLIEAFEIARETNNNIELSILGKGNDKTRLEKIIKSKNMEQCVRMLGQVSMEEYFRLVNDADVIVNSSLKEGAVTVSFDSMALSKPLICVDTGGYTRYFNNDNAIVLKRGARDRLVKDMAEAIIQMTDKEKREEIGRKSHEAGCKYTWSHKGEDIYNTIMREYGAINEN